MRGIDVILVALLITACQGSTGNPVPAVRGLLQRVVPQVAHLFSIVVLDGGPSRFAVDAADSLVTIRGTGGVELAQALNYYLRYCLNSTILWQEARIGFPSGPLPACQFSATRKVELVYYQNVCTFGYTSANWDWKRWEHEIDWMALNGINFPLAFVGQEYVWSQVLRRLAGDANGTVMENDWFSAIEFAPWQRMGNINNWGLLSGRVNETFLLRTKQLQVKILARMRSFGMTPVLPGFAGHLPPSFPRYFPSNNYTKLFWLPGFGETIFLDPTSPLFGKVGKFFMEELIRAYGTDHYYNCDPFNEMMPQSSSNDYLSSVSRALYDALNATDDKAVWVLQGWFLINMKGFWTDTRATAFLNAVPLDNLIVLDLWSEQFPYWNTHANFFGRKFIWSMLHNFGGQTYIYGARSKVDKGLTAALGVNNLVGIGLTMEGTEQNPGMYEYVLDFSFSDPSSDQQWWQRWEQRRYGTNEEGRYWNALSTTLLDSSDVSIDLPGIVSIPSLSHATVSEHLNVTMSLWQLLLSRSESLREEPTYQHDLVEITRQGLGELSRGIYGKMIQGWKSGNTSQFRQYSSVYVQLIADLDAICSLSSLTLLGNWVAKGEQNTGSRVNALLQLTTWGPVYSSLNDYAAKLWAGLIETYYLQRWRLFVDYLESSTPASFNYTSFLLDLFRFQTDFVYNNTNNYSTSVANGDPTSLSQKLFAKYHP